MAEQTPKASVLDHSGPILMLLLAGLIWGIYELPAARAQRQRQMEGDPLVKEFRLIGKPDFATQVGTCTYADKGWWQRWYGCEFAANVDFEEITHFYTGELGRNGWTKVSADPSDHAYWCKNGYMAALERGSVREPPFESYSLSFSYRGQPPRTC